VRNSKKQIKIEGEKSQKTDQNLNKTNEKKKCTMLIEECNYGRFL